MTLKFPNRFLPAIIAIGIVIGVANYSLGFGTSLGSLIFTQIITSLVVGYGLLLVVLNIDLALPQVKDNTRWIVLTVSFCLIGMVATEVEHLNKTMLFHQGSYQLGGGSHYYVFNALISVILGGSFYYHRRKFVLEKKKTSARESNQIRQVPIRKGNGIELMRPEEILYFRAADNHCIAVDHGGREHFCESSLALLEEALRPDFVRLHRSFLVQSIKIRKITPYDKQRFTLHFDNAHTIRSGGTYAGVIRQMMRLSSQTGSI